MDRGRRDIVNQSVTDGITDELGVRLQAHFLQHSTTMRADRLYAQRQFIGDLGHRFARG